MALSIEGDIENRFQKSLLNARLQVAAADGKVNEVNDLVQKGAEVNFRDSDGNSYLHFVAWQGSEVMFQCLINNGAKMSIENNMHETALDVAFSAKKDGIVKLIAAEMIKKTDELGFENYKQQKKINELQTQKGHKQEVGLYPATLRKDYNYNYEDREIDTLMNILCVPLEQDCLKEKNIRFCVIFSISCDKNQTKEIFLIQSEEEKTFFTTSWSQVQVNEGKITEENSVKICCNNNEHDPITSALARSFIIMSESRKKTYPNIWNKENIQNLMRSRKVTHEDWRVFFANLIYELERTHQKAVKWLSFLKVKSENEYRKANILIFFLETFAAQDSYFQIPVTRAAPERLTELRELKKNYLRRISQMLLSEGNQIDVVSISSTMRTNILKKSPSFQVQPESIIVSVNDDLGLDISELFSALKDFAQSVVDYMENKIPGKLPKNTQEVFKKLEENASEFCPAKGRRLRQIDQAIKAFSMDVNKLGEDGNRLQSVLFNLLVNVFPRLEISPLRDSRVRHLRNEVMHNFHNQKATELSQKVPCVIHDLYRYQLALKMHEVLKKRGDNRELAGLKEELSNIMKTVGEHYVNFNLGISTGKGDILYDSCDSSRTREQIPKIVQTYVDCIAPIFDSCSHEEEEDDVVSSPRLVGLQKREIFEKFLAIRNSTETSDHDRVQSLCFELEDKLLQHGIVEATSAVENAFHSSNKQENTTLVTTIQQEVEGLFNVHLSTREFRDKLSCQDVIVLLEGLINNPSYSFGKHAEQIGLCSEGRKFIEEKLTLIVNEEVVDVKWHGKRVKVKKSTVVLSLLKILSEVQRAYQVKFDSIVAAFEDPEFVSYLVEKEMREQATLSIHELAKELPKLRFLAPFIASLVIKRKDFCSLDESSSTILLEMLLHGSSDITYVKDFVALNKDEVTQTMFNIVAEGEGVGEEKAIFILVDIAFKGNLGVVFNNLKDKNSDLKSRHIMEHRIMYLFNKALLETINAGKLHDAENLINEIEKISLDMANSTTTLNLLRAKLLIITGRSLCKNGKDKANKGKGKDCYTKAQDILTALIDSFGENRTNKYYMLALSRLAYTCHLLGKCTNNPIDRRKLNESALKYSERLWCVLWQTISMSSKDPPDFITVLNRADDSEKYRKLMKSGEFWKYLNVPKIRQCVGLYTGLQGKNLKDPKLLEEAIEILREIYDVTAARRKDDFASRRLVGILKHTASNYHDLSLIVNDFERKSFYQLKRFELTLMHYSSGLECFGFDPNHTKLCYRMAKQCKDACTGGRSPAGARGRKRLYSGPDRGDDPKRIRPETRDPNTRHDALTMPMNYQGQRGEQEQIGRAHV